MALCSSKHMPSAMSSRTVVTIRRTRVFVMSTQPMAAAEADGCAPISFYYWPSRQATNLLHLYQADTVSVYQRIRLFVCANSMKTADFDTYQEIPDTGFTFEPSIRRLRFSAVHDPSISRCVGKIYCTASDL